MITRENLEKREHEWLSKFACKADESKGRLKDEEPCHLRTAFQRDRDRIIHSKSFRRLMHKTQVFLAPEGDHFRTRLTHTIEVSQVARTIARALALNEDLTEAIALGHDLGHTPFGHSGEEILDRIFKENKGEDFGFKHNVQSLRVVDVLEGKKMGDGLNLTAEVRDGIVCHSGSKHAFTLEGEIVRLSDRIAYINHDIDDALRSGVIGFDDLPKDLIQILGSPHGERIDTLVTDIVKNSANKNDIKQSQECREAMNSLRTYMFQNVYKNEHVKKHEDLNKVEIVIRSLFDYYIKNPEKLPDEFLALQLRFERDELVKDYIAGMTDRYALTLYSEIFLPKGWK